MNVRRMTVISLIYGIALLSVGCRRETSETTVTTGTVTGTGQTATAATATQPADLSTSNVNTVIVLDTKKFVEKSTLGTPDKSGNVTVQKETFKRGEPVSITMWLTQSPAGLQTSALWYDENDKLVFEERKEMKGAKVATYTWNAKKAKPGRYRVVGYWGGNIAAEHVFTVGK